MLEEAGSIRSLLSRIIYRDIGMADNVMDAAEQPPFITPALTGKEELIRLLA